MKCLFCDARISPETSSCQKCGKDVTKEVHHFSDAKIKSDQRKHFFAFIISIIITFSILMLFTVVFLLKSTNSKETIQHPLFVEKKEDKLIAINIPDNEKISALPSLRREGYDVIEKPFVNDLYDYDERTRDFRMVCTKPCPVSRKILDQEFAAISYAISTLRGLTQSDINKEYLPFEVHASADSTCPLPEATTLAYATIFNDANGHRRGLLCFFYDKKAYDRSKFPYSASIHEVTHLFEFGKLPSNNVLQEGLSEVMDSFFLKGNNKASFCWNNNKWWIEELGINPNDPHDIGRNLFFELCNQYRFDYNNLPELFKQLQAKGENINEREFVNIINDIVGIDTSNLFREAGVI